MKTAWLLLIGILTLMWGPSPFGWTPVMDERLPRLIVLLVSGASLAVAGAVMQALFQNPLASSSTLGINFGGSLLVVIVCAFDLHMNSPYMVPAAAFAGCLLTLFIVYMLSRTQGIVHLNTFFLTGIAISTVLLAFQSTLLYALRDRWQLIQTLAEWEAGSTYDISWKQVHMQLPLALIGLSVCFYYRKALNVLSLGMEEASILGIEVSQVRFRLFLAVSLLTGGTLASIGTVAFFGLIMPHVLRSWQGSNNTQLIPSCCLMGAAVLSCLDLSLRVLNIHSITIGSVSALFGGVFFMILLFKRKECYA